MAELSTNPFDASRFGSGRAAADSDAVTTTTDSGSSPAPGLGAFSPDPERPAPQPAMPPPIGWLVAAVAAAVVSVVLGALAWGDHVALHIAGWAIGGPVAIGLLALYSARETAASRQLYYFVRPWSRWAYSAALTLTFAGIVLNAIRIAFWAGRL